METLNSVDREGRERLNPSVTNPSYLVLKKRRQVFERWFASLEAGQLDVLDVGGRIQPYRSILAGRVRRYIAIDMRQTPLVDVLARGEQIPLAGEQFDVVICTQVLQYVPEPAVVISEMRRVLRPGGRLLLSVPAIYPRDCDKDTWRFLPESLRFLLQSFDSVEIVAEGSSIAGFFRTICMCISMFGRPAFVGWLSRFALIPVLNMTAESLESLWSGWNDRFAANFSALARK